MTDEIILAIRKNIIWLEEHARSDSVVPISKVVTKLQIQSMTLADEVIKAYALMNEAEDEYKIAVDEFIKNYDGSAAAAEPRARAAAADLKRQWTAAKNGYKRLDITMDRIDKICDTVRQRVSVIKQTDLKNV